MTKNGKPTVEELSKAFDSILESVLEETGLGTSNKCEHKSYAVDRLYNFAASEFRRHASPTTSTSEIVSCCDDFISDWETSGSKSAAVQQLIAVLKRPHIRGLLWATEDIAAQRYAPELPPIPFEVDEDEGIAVKIVRIVRRDEPLGATIKCDHGKVYVARIMAGGVADRSGCIQEGDRVLEVNGESVLDKRSDEIVALLNKCDGGCVTFKLVPAEVWNNHAAKSHNNNDKSHIHLKALFDYEGGKDPRHPCPEAALSFKRGDILELLVCNDEFWWQARRIGYGALAYSKERDDEHGSKGVGLIPSETLQQKTRSLENGNEKKSSLNSLTRGVIASRHRLNEASEEKYYESVCRSRLNIIRPIVLIGPPGVGRNELKRRLLMLFPERFSTTVPHTSRQQRVNEIEGVDYYFTQRKAIEKMIEKDEMLEFGEFKGNLYGTAVSSVRLARKKGTPLLTPHPLALRNLRTAEFAPIIIFVQPPSFHDFKETREAFRSRMTRAQSAASSNNASTMGSGLGRGFTDTEIRQIIDNAISMEKTYGHMFDARIVNTNLDDTMSELIKLIHLLETKPTWVPLNWATKPN
ncbi:unnamed protein product [Caenorhabditis bovis]|uniref:MAGUK p55 subfamily member 7 n=1 Tax=Caenorhabditis bovis TaxID=2654633 RepID=A0A8S1ES46_9PELO|nr:unnamed protein product [Caenorhabditis bovis]